ncbi:MAG: hypothetical protein KatS3mg053_0443 [Candidatus Roseilinea sp.]|nr:MAG: hypothetical protein KatS3mg053_0443 [Candidatus Roseilinea sp.]
MSEYSYPKKYDFLLIAQVYHPPTLFGPAKYHFGIFVIQLEELNRYIKVRFFLPGVENGGPKPKNTKVSKGKSI